jgi:hypothetical protein
MIKKDVMYRVKTLGLKKFLFIVTMVFTISCINGCSKKNGDDANAAEVNRIKTALEGKWNFVNYSKNHYYSGKDHINTTTASSGDYFLFAADGTLTLRLLNFEDRTKYSILPTSKVVFYGVDAFDIKTLTTNQLVLYRKDLISAEQYYEETYTLQK